MTCVETQQRWAAFKAKRAAQHERDMRIKMMVKDFLGLCELVGMMTIAWFFLAVLYA